MTSEQTTLLNLLSNTLFHNHISIPDEMDWSAVYKEAKLHTVALTIFANLDISSNIQDIIGRELAMTLFNNMQVIYEHSELDELLKAHHIPYVILKGCASARYYNDPTLRTMGDVDFLVSPEDMEKAGELLKNSGFQPWEEEHICHVVYIRGAAHLEMHFEPAGVPSGKVGVKVRNYLSDTLESSVEYKTDTESMMVPDHFHHGLIILLHTSHHITGEGIGLRHLCDWAVYANSVDVPSVLGNCLKDIGMWRFAQLLTQLACKYLGMPEQAWAMEDVNEDLLESMMDDIFASGNFGQKDPERSNEAYLISSRGKHGVTNISIAKQIVISMNEAVYTHMPIAKQWKILLPISWIIVGGKQIGLILSRKRKKIHIRKMINGASKRKEIYKQFHLFEM